jgi:dTDP-4-dehydrorhamnose reductase
MNSVLDCGKITETFGISSSPWRRNLATVIQELIDRAFPT